jgi:hypothetical protein
VSAEAIAPEGAAEKRQFLVQIDADLIRRIKILAIERSVTASSLVQHALAEFLGRQGSPPPGATPSEAEPCS